MTTTVAQAHRQLVAEMDEAGDSPAEIARKLGISVDRVEAILDQLDESDGRPPHPDDDHRAPAVEPVRPDPRPAAEAAPIVVGSPARAPRTKPTVDVRPVPFVEDPDELLSEPEPAPTEEPSRDLADGVERDGTPILASRAAELSIKLADTAPPAACCGEKQGTYAGYQRHRNRKDEPCGPCRQAARDYARDHAAAKREGQPPKRKGPTPSETIEHGTLAGYGRHRRAIEKPCRPCLDAYNDRQRRIRQEEREAAAAGRSGCDDGGLLMGDVAAAFGKLAAAREDVLTPARRPGGAVAHLSLPIAAAALIAVVDALELAYGPGIRLDAADGGVWVLGRAS